MKKIADFFLFLMFLLIKSVLFLLPRRACLGLGRILGVLFYHSDRNRRQIALSNLTFAFGDIHTPDELVALAKNSFSHFGEVMLDVIKFSTLSKKRRARLIDVEGAEHIQNALKKNKGVLLFTGHFGNWEIAPSFVSSLGDLRVMARPLDNLFLEKELLRMRRKLGEKVIYKQRAAREVLRALGENAMVAILIDQNVLENEAVFVDFFGKSAATTPGLATFHVRTGAPIIPVFCTPTPQNTFSIKILSPVEVPLTGEHREDVLKITQICTKMIESQIRDNPGFWLWLHNRWKTRPEPEKNLPV